MADDDTNKARQKNFEYLKDGLTEKYVVDKPDLIGMQKNSILKLVDTNKGDYSLSSGYFHACTGFGKTFLMKALAEGYYSQNKKKKIVIFEEKRSYLAQAKEFFERMDPKIRKNYILAKALKNINDGHD